MIKLLPERRRVDPQQMKFKFFFSAFFFISIWFNFSSCQQRLYPKISLESTDIKQGNEFLRRAAVYMLDKDLKLALTESNKALKSFPPELRQKAVFQKGVIYAHPDNENQNLKKAVFYFEIAEKEQKDIKIQAYAKFLKDVCKKNMVQQSITKKLEQNFALLTQKNEVFLSKQDEWQKNRQQLEKENRDLKTKLKTLKKEMQNIQEEGFKEVIIKEAAIKEEALNQ